ncbi:MAG TPA: exosortase family protein XrtF [Flavobacterium sp.]|nr:exosortase family protein XrtF [Flavobacterium sp.]
MKTYFRQYRPFFIFLFRFFAVYAGLTLIYKLYLKQFDNLLVFEVDDFTAALANQVQWVLGLLNYKCSLMVHDNQASIKLFLEGQYVARIVEGCNALSVMILFAAFVVAFTGKWLRTLVFIVLGSAIIHLLNIVRIVLLSIALLNYPEQENLLHGVVFPLFIYGVVFGLWVVWVNKYSNYASGTAE